MPLSPDELQRYARHLVLPQVGATGQERLRASSALVIGLGGLGSPAALYLAAAGVGRLGILDHDTVAVHNLQRQIIHDTSTLGAPKVDSARVRIEALNPYVRIETWRTALTRDNARGIVSDYDVILDGTDSFATRYLVNDACVLEGKPYVHASVHRFEGQLSVFGAPHGPCYRCLHPTPPPAGSVPNCAEGGVLGVLPGLLGTMQATEALKLLLGIGAPMVGRLLVVDALGMRFQEVQVDRDDECPWCGKRTERELLADYAAFCGEGPAATSAAASADASADASGDASGGGAPDATSITPRQLAARLARGDALRVIDVREPWEHAVASLEPAELIPMQTIPARHSALPRETEYVVLCHHGMRSAMVADYLRTVGFTRVLNLEGGIDRWSVEVDPSVSRY
ncbi:MAG: molybdopterin-synthase adenylyltransferase MoeB [Gemmatimonadetes bacterium]|nr:molybdopterin-synthase adenylyltransferase MoeB [Gemmatimonadota bacterium]